MRLIAGLDRLDAGSIQIAGRPSADLPKHAGIAFVFQDAHLLPWRNVLRNVELPLELLGIGRPQRSELARQAIEEVGLSDAITRWSHAAFRRNADARVSRPGTSHPAAPAPPG